MSEELDAAARAIKHRLYRAVASEQFWLDENDERVPVELRSG